jgi:hypothetical protein
MNPPIINLDEPIGKWVGRRRSPGALNPATSTSAQSRGWRSALGGVFPKGVYKFNTHEEANKWELKMLTRSRNKES